VFRGRSKFRIASYSLVGKGKPASALIEKLIRVFIGLQLTHVKKKSAVFVTKHSHDCHIYDFFSLSKDSIKSIHTGLYQNLSHRHLNTYDNTILWVDRKNQPL
jgi:hypothetical protein